MVRSTPQLSQGLSYDVLQSDATSVGHLLRMAEDEAGGVAPDGALCHDHENEGQLVAAATLWRRPGPRLAQGALNSL